MRLFKNPEELKVLVPSDNMGDYIDNVKDKDFIICRNFIIIKNIINNSLIDMISNNLKKKMVWFDYEDDNGEFIESEMIFNLLVENGWGCNKYYFNGNGEACDEIMIYVNNPYFKENL